MENLYYVYMKCGCVFPVNSTTDIRYCPEHDQPRDYFTRPCERCGTIKKVQNLNQNNYICEECNNIVQQSKVVYNNHNLEYIDPVLWHKEIIEVLDDISTNAFFGYEEIQIDEPIRVQHQKETVTIRMKEKIRNLEYMRP